MPNKQTTSTSSRNPSNNTTGSTMHGRGSHAEEQPRDDHGRFVSEADSNDSLESPDDSRN